MGNTISVRKNQDTTPNSVQDTANPWERNQVVKWLGRPRVRALSALSLEAGLLYSIQTEYSLVCKRGIKQIILP